MKTAFPPCPDHTDWKILYRAAILETNKNTIPQKVSEAEQAVLTRRKELFCCVASKEKESLEDALYTLRAYRDAWEHTEAEITNAAVKTVA